ncbi:MAG: acyl--CoA ligase [Leptospiraceae bacterium]|nr:acyl--CoA ligase [Leptospiraceae bacterium]
MNNLTYTILNSGKEIPESVFLECENNPLSWKEITILVNKRVNQFTKEGLKTGDKIIVATGRGNNVWIDMMSIWFIGAIVVPLEYEVTEETLNKIVKKVQPKALCGDFEKAKVLNYDIKFIQELNPENEDISDKEIIDLPEESLAMILFTSGSTGEPKGVMLTHKSLLLNAESTKKVLKLNSTHRLFMAIPFRFVSAISHFLVAALSNTTLLGTEKKYFKGDYIQTIKDVNANATGGSPIQARWIAETIQNEKLNINWVMSSGDHFAKEVIELFLLNAPEIRVNVVYGLTELAGRFCIAPFEELKDNLGSVGKPIEGLEVLILNDDYLPAKINETGHVFARGKMVFKGYYEDLETSNEALLKEGFKTGDMGRMDENGWLYLSGRSDDVFKYAGIKVSTLPIRDALMDSGYFKDVAVVPKEHPVIGQVPFVYYVLNNEKSFEKGKILKFLRQTLAPNQLPEGFSPITEIPRTGSGKIDRRKLKEIIENN